jgi:hypothetical protein
LGCQANAKTFSLYCALKKASEEATGRFDHRARVMEYTRYTVDEVAANRSSFQHRLEGYNNSPQTTFDDIQRVLQLVAEHIQQRIKDDAATK